MRTIRVVLIAGLLAVASIVSTAGGVGAYGAADHPLAQIEYSANCNNLQLCGGGGGGVWVWIEIDDGAILGDGMGTADVAGAGCHHLPGVASGAGSIRGEFPWYWSSDPVGLDATMGTWNDPNGDGWYVIVAPGMGPASFPVTKGHYAAHPAPAINFNLQVAPSGRP